MLLAIASGEPGAAFSPSVAAKLDVAVIITTSFVQGRKQGEFLTDDQDMRIFAPFEVKNEAKKGPPRPSVMAAYQASHHKFAALYRILARGDAPGGRRRNRPLDYERLRC